jgi:hypothetical protein
MTTRVSITRNGQLTNQQTLDSIEEANAWLARHEGMGTFGQKKETVERQVLIFPAVVDSEGLEISPAQFEAQMVDLEGYTVEMLDISAQLEQEATNAAALKLLAESDWMITRMAETQQPIPEEVLLARAAARASIVR